MDSCIFCRIARKEVPSKTVYEDDQVLAFHDLDPKAPVHVLIIPKAHIASHNEVTEENSGVFAHIAARIPALAETLKVKASGYRVVVNCGSDGAQSVGHLHYHLLGGRKMGWPPG